MEHNIVDIDESLRLVGTAHVSSESVELVKSQIAEYQPDIVAVELCESRLAALTRPESIENEDLLKIINEGRSMMILLQSALSAQQRKMGLNTGEKPGAELLAAVNTAKENDIEYELIDRDVVITLRRAWYKMGLREKWRVLNALMFEDEDEEEHDIEELLRDSDLMTQMMEETRAVAPNAGSVLIDERDQFLAGNLQNLRPRGKILAIVGAGHLTGIKRILSDVQRNPAEQLDQLNEQPKKPVWPKLVMLAIPLILGGAMVKMYLDGDLVALKDAIWYWMAVNAGLTGLGVLIARGHIFSAIVGAIASPITSLNPSLAAGWFAGYTQLKVAPPTGKDAAEFLTMADYDVFFKNRVGRVLMVTALGNLGSVIGTWIASGVIVKLIIG